MRQILDTIAAHPEVREPVLRVLLTQDFLALPGRVDALSEQVQGLSEDFEEFREETREQFRAVNERIDGTNERIDGTNERIDTVSERIDATNERIDTVSERVDTVNERIDTVNERIDATNERIDETNLQLAENTRLLAENTSAIRRLEGHVGRMRGISYEDTCRHEIVAVMDGWLEDPIIADREPINEQLRTARHTGLITRNEYLDGLRPDIIARAGVNDSGLLAVAEASVTFNRGDLETAARRAEIIARVVGVRTAAFVVTNYQWPDALNEVARQLGVTIIHHEVPEFTET